MPPPPPPPPPPVGPAHPPRSAACAAVRSSLPAKRTATAPSASRATPTAPAVLPTVAREPTPAERAAYDKAVADTTRRPARRQVCPDTAEQTLKVFEGTYNIWYNKWTGQKHKGRFEIGERAPTRVNPARDAGYTLADKRRAQNPSHRTSFCLSFARGNCTVGHKCEYLHRVPLPLDHEETSKDCFGRERHRDERDDMNGVGCFNRENRTLYIGNIHPYQGSEANKVVRRHFAPFGDIEKVNFIPEKSISFVKYVKRANAEFAKEAMEHQALDAGEIINVRWAYDDPNPRIVAEEKTRVELTFVEHYLAKKARSGESEFMDEETKAIIAANPQYADYYKYVEISEEPLVLPAHNIPSGGGLADPNINPNHNSAAVDSLLPSLPSLPPPLTATAATATAAPSLPQKPSKTTVPAGVSLPPRPHAAPILQGGKYVLPILNPPAVMLDTSPVAAQNSRKMSSASSLLKTDAATGSKNMNYSKSSSESLSPISGTKSSNSPSGCVNGSSRKAEVKTTDTGSLGLPTADMPVVLEKRSPQASLPESSSVFRNKILTEDFVHGDRDDTSFNNIGATAVSTKNTRKFSSKTEKNDSSSSSNSGLLQGLLSRVYDSDDDE